MSSKKEDSIVLEPFTKITSFDGIAYVKGWDMSVGKEESQANKYVKTFF